MARKTQKDAEKTRTKILASALSLFAKKGYEHTTFADVAARLDMTKGAVYWHFESKEALLMALVDEMLEKFQRQIGDMMPQSDLSFPAVADMMVKHAIRLLEDAKGTAFFLLMHEQVQWASDSMAKVREDLLTNERFGPWHAFHAAVANDVAAGRARADVSAERVAHTCVAIWDGLVHARIAKFMTCDLKETMEHAFAGVWNAIKAG
ncbi:MAG: TetR family transcriptional regulator [Kiritimatiellae bacterium]|nr:TetR family transcriptional regulator [Kiritimatiellia bacterium]